MELVRTNENVTKSYDENGKVTENVTSVNYNVVDSRGANVGNASVWSGGYSLNVSKPGSVEDLVAEVEGFFNYSEEE